MTLILLPAPKTSDIDQVKELEKSVAASRKGLAKKPSAANALILQKDLMKRDQKVREIRNTFRVVE